MLIVQGSKDVVEFLVVNSTVVDIPGKRDTKKVMKIMIAQNYDVDDDDANNYFNTFIDC